MTAGTAPAHNSGNRIKSLIERRLLTPAYVGMVAGLLIRSIALVLSIATPYGSWPVLVRLIIEGCAAVGMVGCADIVLSVASAAHAAIDRQIDAARNSPEYTPNPRLSPARYEQTKQALEARRALVLAGLMRERRKEWVAVLFSAGVTVSYGVLFGLTVMSHASPITIGVEVVGVAAIPFVTWYLSAQYREEQPAPEEHAKGLALLAIDQRLHAAHTRLSTGAETESDISLLEVGTEASVYHNRLVRALRRPAESAGYLTTPQLYQLLGVTDSSGQASIRRIVRKAGDAQQYGVIRDTKKDAWLTPKSAVVELFPQFIGQGTKASAGRTPASARRATNPPQSSRIAQTGEQGSNSVRTTGGATTPRVGAPGRVAEGVRLAEPLR